ERPASRFELPQAPRPLAEIAAQGDGDVRHLSPCFQAETKAQRAAQRFVIRVRSAVDNLRFTRHARGGGKRRRLERRRAWPERDTLAGIHRSQHAFNVAKRLLVTPVPAGCAILSQGKTSLRSRNNSPMDSKFIERS